jgi:argininosuccinate lyase
MVPLVRKSSGGDSVKPSGGKLHTFRSREDRHQKGTSRLIMKKENTDLRHGVQGEQLSLFIVFTTEKV